MKPEQEDRMELVDPDSDAGSFHTGQRAEQDVSPKREKERYIRGKGYYTTDHRLHSYDRLQNTRRERYIRLGPYHSIDYNPLSLFDRGHNGLFSSPGRQDHV